MAKIIYFKSPVDESQIVEIEVEGTLLDALRDLGIEKDPLSVSINGYTPDDLDLLTEIDDEDIIEIRRPVHGGGGGDARRKSDIATVVQIAALVTVTYLTAGGASPWLAAAVAGGGALVAGALNKWAADILGSQQISVDAQEVATQTNDYSSKSATNKARPLASIPVPIGSHRYAPDVHTEPFVDRYDQENEYIESTPFSETKNSGIVASNGPMAPDNSWITIPVGYISPAVGGNPATAIPRYPIKVSPFGFTDKTTALDPDEEEEIREEIRDSILDDASLGRAPHTNWYYYFTLLRTKYAFPVVIYHFDPSDPNRGRFNLFWSLAVISNVVLRNISPGTFPRASYWDQLGRFFTGANTGSFPIYAFFSSTYTAISNINQLLTIIFPGSTTAIPSTIADTNDLTYGSRYAAFLTTLNGGSYTTTDKTTAPDITTTIIPYKIDQTYAGIPISTQIFNYGFGDLDIVDRSVGTVPVTIPNPQSGFSVVEKQNQASTRWWLVKQLSVVGVPALSTITFMNEVKNFPPKSLINPDIKDGTVDPSDDGSYNFNYYAGKAGLRFFKFSISGRVYRTSSSGFLQNVTRIQVQYRFSSDRVWTNYDPYVISVENNRTNLIYMTYFISTFFPPPSAEDFMEVRIRKVNFDSSDNKDDRVSELSIVDACFYDTGVNHPYDIPWKRNIPMNLEGLYTTALISDSSTTNQYSALVESKCWVYDFDTEEWSWEATRNPAFWFLYFARGGFLNETALGDLAPPYSPTYGWVNYPGHPDNTAHIFGGGYKDEEIDIEKIKEWAYFCDEHDLKIDMVIKDDTSVADILERIANIGRASVSYNVGKLSVVIEDPEQVPVAMFGMGNIIAGSFTVDYAVGEQVRTVKGSFTNRESWEAETVEALVPFSDSDIVRDIQITMDGITEKTQAQREINILAARQFYQRRSYTWETDAEGYLAKRGDVVILSHDSTQYGFSGRIYEFVVESGVVKGFKTGSNIDSEIEYVTIRTPRGELATYQCEVKDGMVSFIDLFPIERAPAIVNLNDSNESAEIPNSIAEDFVFVADIKETPGKRVRIASVEALESGNFKFTAVDEDPAMWAYEYDDLEPAESFDDSQVVAEIIRFEFVDEGGGKIRLMWESSGTDLVQIVNLATGLPLEANGQFSFGSSSEVVFDLIQGVKYKLEARPLTYAPSVKRAKVIELWPL